MIVESAYLDGIGLEAYDVMQNPCKFYQEVTESLSILGLLIGCFKEYFGLLCPMIQGEDSWRADGKLWRHQGIRDHTKSCHVNFQGMMCI